MNGRVSDLVAALNALARVQENGDTIVYKEIQAVIKELMDELGL